MNFEPLRRVLVRLFRPRATSVSPQISEDAIIDRMVERGLIEPAWTREPSAHAVQIESGAVDTRPGIKPPDNEMPWPDWRKLEADLDAPAGWSACRFPTWRPGDQTHPDQSAADAGTCAFVFGITRGDFGIWRSPFPVCITGDDGMFIDQREDVLAAVTHLPTGLGMGIFADRASAVASCDAADGLGIDWRKLNPNEKRHWMQSFSRLRQAREFAGIAIVHDRHAHLGSPDGPRISIWQQRADAMAEGRPEKLS